MVLFCNPAPPCLLLFCILHSGKSKRKEKDANLAREKCFQSRQFGIPRYEGKIEENVAGLPCSESRMDLVANCNSVPRLKITFAFRCSGRHQEVHWT